METMNNTSIRLSKLTLTEMSKGISSDILRRPQRTRTQKCGEKSILQKWQTKDKGRLWKYFRLKQPKEVQQLDEILDPLFGEKINATEEIREPIEKFEYG